MQTAPPPLYCLPGGLCPTAGVMPLTPTSLPDLIQTPWGSLPLPALCSICTQDSRTTCLYSSCLYQALDHREYPQVFIMINREMQGSRRLVELWLQSAQVPFHPWLPCVCPVLPIFILCLLPKKESRQLLALGTWNRPRTVFSFQV